MQKTTARIPIKCNRGPLKSDKMTLHHYIVVPNLNIPDFDNDSPNSLTRVRDPLNQRFEGLLLRRVV